jgi:hypothetical protein
MKTWKTTPPELILETLRRIDDARGLYLPSDFPAEVQELVERDYNRLFSGEDAKHAIYLDDGSEPEAVNAVLGLRLAHRITTELEITRPDVTGWQRDLRNIKEAVALHFSGCGTC